MAGGTTKATTKKTAASVKTSFLCINIKKYTRFSSY